MEVLQTSPLGHLGTAPLIKAPREVMTKTFRAEQQKYIGICAQCEAVLRHGVASSTTSRLLRQKSLGLAQTLEQHSATIARLLKSDLLFSRRNPDALFATKHLA